MSAEENKLVEVAPGITATKSERVWNKRQVFLLMQNAEDKNQFRAFDGVKYERVGGTLRRLSTKAQKKRMHKVEKLFNQEQRKAFKNAAQS